MEMPYIYPWLEGCDMTFQSGSQRTRECGSQVIISTILQKSHKIDFKQIKKSIQGIGESTEYNEKTRTMRVSMQSTKQLQYPVIGRIQLSVNTALHRQIGRDGFAHPTTKYKLQPPGWIQE